VYQTAYLKCKSAKKNDQVIKCNTEVIRIKNHVSVHIDLFNPCLGSKDENIVRLSPVFNLATSVKSKVSYVLIS
jgi:hypothetical protein